MLVPYTCPLMYYVPTEKDQNCDSSVRVNTIYYRASVATLDDNGQPDY